MYEKINPKLLSWASEVDDGTIRQAEKTARLPIVEGHVALMPDAHVGIGATVGSVIPTKGAVIPSAVGVDIGCGMIAAELDVTESQLPDNLEPLLSRIERAVRVPLAQPIVRVGDTVAGQPRRDGIDGPQVASIAHGAQAQPDLDPARAHTYAR